MLRFSHLTLAYKGAPPLAQGLCGTLAVGSVTALIGANGRGKSTLLRALCGLHRYIPAGSIAWQGRALRSLSPRELARTVAVVLTAPPEDQSLTARELVALGRIPHTGFAGRLGASDRSRVAAALEAVDAAALSEKPLYALSDGERTRVSIARALAQDTPAIVLDEPTAYLDFSTRAALLQLLHGLAAQHGKTILFSTHDLELAFRLADRLWLLTPQGLEEGTPRALSESGAISRAFATDHLRYDAATMRFHTAP